MASSRPHERRDDGYATPAAMVFGLALALVCTALVGRSVMMLRLARADLARRSAEYVLDGAHLAAAATTIRAGEGGPYRWSLATDAGFAEALVERETDKLSPAAAAGLPDDSFTGLGVADPPALKARLAAAPEDGVVDVAALDSAPRWGECAPSLISSLGQASAPPTATPVEPRLRPETPDWRVGQTWRVRVTTAAGWRDDRIVRFTGDARHPVAVVWRKLSRSDGGQGTCDAAFAATG